MEAEIDYPFIPCIGAAFKRADNNELINLQDLVLLINDVGRQRSALSALGISIKDKLLSINFTERGKAYRDPLNDRTQTEENESEIKFFCDIITQDEIPECLPLRVQIGGWVQENINFLGKIEVHNSYVIPLTGRGTAALEGKSNDCHAGFCTGGACASFQERAALILAISLAAGASKEDIQMLADEFATVDARYHGRRAILDYTVHCCLNHSHEAGSYREFMIRRGEVSATMDSLLTEPNAFPGPEYFSKVRAKLSEAELRARAVHESPAVEEDIYPVVPRAPVIPGIPSLLDLAEKLAFPPSQLEALRLLGFEQSDSQVDLSFTESGRAYLQPRVDRQLVDKDSSEAQFRLTMEKTEQIGNLSIKVELGSWIQDGVNFLGVVQVQLGEDNFVLPLTGRGTAALEGKRRDAHAGFCTGGACAGFQVRAALCLAVARAIGASNSDIEALGRQLHSINSRYHGRDDILDYTIYCALTPNSESYLMFMVARHGSEDNRYPLLQAMRATGMPHRGYFEALFKKYSTEELDEERSRKPPAYTAPNIYAVPSLSVEEVEETVEAGKGNPKAKKSTDWFTRIVIAVSVVACVIVIIVFFAVPR